MTAWETLGEAFVERELRKEKRAGVDHYVVGQYDALLAGEPGEEGYGDAVILTYVSHLGVVMVVLVEKGGLWLPVISKYRVVGLTMDYGLLDLPEDWEASDEMKAAIEKARKK